MHEKNYVHEKILRTRNCHREFIKNLLPEKRKENMQTKQPRFKSRLNKSNVVECTSDYLLYTTNKRDGWLYRCLKAYRDKKILAHLNINLIRKKSGISTKNFEKRLRD